LDYKKLLNSHVESIPPYVPGKSIQVTSAEIGIPPENIIKLASNENPLGPSPAAIDAAKKSLANSNMYPLADAENLRKAIAENLSFSPENIFATGPGMDSLIDSLSKAVLSSGDEVVISTPTFSFYEISAKTYGATPVFVQRKENFDIDPDEIINSVGENTKIIFLCSPNNPTGNSISEKDIRHICKNSNCIVFLDEAYIEFSTKPSMVHLLKEFDNLIIGRTFSKVYGLAGLRIGYGIMSREIVKDLLKISLPFSISSVSESAAIAALSDFEYIEKSKKLVHEGIKQLTDGIHNNTKFKVYPTDGNFIAVNVYPYTSKQVSEHLLNNGVIIRNCESFRGSGRNLIRITIGTEEMNKKVIKLLSNFKQF